MQIRVGTVVTVLVAVLMAGRVWAGGAQKETKAQKGQMCTLKVSGMTCSACEEAVKNAAKEISGVKDATVSYEKGTAEVTYDAQKTTPEAIATAISEKTEFKAEAPKKDKP